jgi:hypothetical protein
MLGESRWHIKPPHLTCAACQTDLTDTCQEALWNPRIKKVFCNSCASQQGLANETQGGFTRVSKLQQFVFLLRVALARLLAVLHAGGTLQPTSGMVSRRNANTGQPWVNTAFSR